MTLAQLLGGQRWPEVRVTLLNQAERDSFAVGRQPIVAGPAALSVIFNRSAAVMTSCLAIVGVSIAFKRTG